MHIRPISTSAICILGLLLLATPVTGQIPTVFDRSALFVAGATGFDPSDTGIWHNSVGVEFGYRVAPRIRPHGAVTQWRFDRESCLASSCKFTATELGIGVDVLERASWVELLAGPRVGYIQQNSDSRFTWKVRAGAVFAPNRSVAPRLELSYWTDPDQDRKGVFAALGVHIVLGNAGGTRTAMTY
jgi:hypothetical protein